jgi:hypothetical protein
MFSSFHFQGMLQLGYNNPESRDEPAFRSAEPPHLSSRQAGKCDFLGFLYKPSQIDKIGGGVAKTKQCSIVSTSTRTAIAVGSRILMGLYSVRRTFSSSAASADTVAFLEANIFVGITLWKNKS